MPFTLAVGQEVCVWAPLVCSAGMNMPLHQISVIPRDVTSSRVSGSGKAKDKDKQVCEELNSQIRSRKAGDTSEDYGPVLSHEHTSAEPIIQIAEVELLMSHTFDVCDLSFIAISAENKRQSNKMKTSELSH